MPEPSRGSHTVAFVLAAVAVLAAVTTALDQLTDLVDAGLGGIPIGLAVISGAFAVLRWKRQSVVRQPERDPLFLAASALTAVLFGVGAVTVIRTRDGERSVQADAETAPSRSTVSGTVLDSSNGLAMAGVDVAFFRQPRSQGFRLATKSSATGRYSIELPAGDWEVSAGKLGDPCVTYGLASGGNAITVPGRSTVDLVGVRNC